MCNQFFFIFYALHQDTKHSEAQSVCHTHTVGHNHRARSHGSWKCIQQRHQWSCKRMTEISAAPIMKSQADTRAAQSVENLSLRCQNAEWTYCRELLQLQWVIFYVSSVHVWHDSMSGKSDGALDALWPATLSTCRWAYRAKCQRDGWIKGKKENVLGALKRLYCHAAKLGRSRSQTMLVEWK